MQDLPREHLEKIYERINIRLLPFLGICYLFAYLDRTNIGFAKLQMQSDLNLSDAAYGLGAGIFFIGYILFEVPSNLWLARIGARKSLSRILILWGCVSTSMLFVSDATTFYLLRFLLGAFEAGFAPGMILYLTYWYSGARMARALAYVLCAAPVSGIVGGIASAWLMRNLVDLCGLSGWQWMFLVEGLPAIFLGIFAFFYLTDKPQNADWLSDAEKALLAVDLTQIKIKSPIAFRQLLLQPKMYGFAATYFCLICGLYAVGFWLPTFLISAGVSDLIEIGYYSAIPYVAAVASMVLISQSSDRLDERRWHSVVPAMLAAAALAIAIFSTTSFLTSFIGVTAATAFMFAAYSVFWSIPAEYFKGHAAAAGGIALINSIGLLGGFLSPTIIGRMKTVTGTLQSGLLIIVFLLVAGAILLFFNSSASKATEIEKEG